MLLCGVKIIVIGPGLASARSVKDMGIYPRFFATIPPYWRCQMKKTFVAPNLVEEKSLATLTLGLTPQTSGAHSY